ncbi:MAG TPA: PAS domain S-box protein, partial [Nitrospiria bacterium]|nr:PAS domain S-box protein [Nitrospiria bacterium]
MGRTVEQKNTPFSTWNSMANRILEAAPDAFVLVDSKGQILFVNRETVRMFGFEREELTGKTVEVLIPERFRSLHVEYRASFMAENRHRPMKSGVKLLGRRKDGSEFEVDIGLSPIGSGEGALVGAFIRDISDQKKVEIKLRQSREDLEERVRERTAELVKANLALESEVGQRKHAE